jgi:hypothetical protein
VELQRSEYSKLSIGRATSRCLPVPTLAAVEKVFFIRRRPCRRTSSKYTHKTSYTASSQNILFFNTHSLETHNLTSLIARSVAT